MYRPKKSDTSYLAQFYYADEQLNCIAAELDSFDGRKDPERCTILVNQLRHSQDEVLAVIDRIMCDVVPENSRACRDYRVKFPDDVLHESLAGQLWFGAECLAAGSSIMNREVESASMRPLAKTLTRHLDSLRSLLREQCFRNQNKFTDKIHDSLVELDRLFAEFELSYVSAMVPVKTMKEYELLQDLTVLFCETVDRALQVGLLTQDMIDMYDPALMFTIPRLAIVSGLIIHPEGPLNPDKDPMSLSEMFRPFQTLLYKIRELLWTLSDAELNLLEKSLCSADDTDRSSAMLAELSGLPPELLLSCDVQPISDFYTDDLSDTDDSAASRGLMVHSESTMTVVARPVDEAEATSSTANISDVEARQLHHSKSWPQSAEGSSHAAAGPTTSFDGVTTSAVTVYGSQQRFNFNLPHNTSTEHIYPNTQTAAERFADQSIIFLSSPSSSVNDEQQIAYITDELCRIFCTDTASLDDDDDDDDGTEVATDVNTTGESLPSSEAEVPASVQQQSLEVIVCDCENSAEQITSVGNVTIDAADAVTTRQHEGEDAAFSCLPSSASKSSLTVSPADGSLVDIMTDVEPDLSLSTPKLPSNELQLSADTDADDVCCNSVLTDAISSADNSQRVEVSMEDVVLSLEETGNDVDVSPTSCHVTDCEVKSSPSSSTHNSRHYDRVKESSLTHVIDTDTSKLPDCHKCQSWSQTQGWNCATAAAASDNVEPSHEHESCSSETSSYSSECRDDEEIALAIHAAEMTARHEARSRFKNATDLIHRLFVCISGVADQLQTNYASDLRHMLKSVFDSYISDAVARLDAAEDGSSVDTFNHRLPPQSTESRTVTSDETAPDDNNHDTATSPIGGGPVWLPDDQSLVCMSCHATFTFVKRRHHCRNCGKIFCGHCSSNTVPLPHFGHDKPVRVCNHCFVFHVTPFTMSPSSAAVATASDINRHVH